MPGPTGRAPAGTELQGCRPGLPPCRRLREPVRQAVARGAMKREIASPALSSSTVTGPRYTRIPAHAPLAVPPLIQLVGHRPLEAVDPHFQSGVPRDLPLPTQPSLQAYFILNTSGKRGPWVGTWSAPWSRCCYGILDGAGHLFDSLVNCPLVDRHGICRESVFKAGLECSLAHSREVGAVWYVVKGCST
jgi:hypothetical protein